MAELRHGEQRHVVRADVIETVLPLGFAHGIGEHAAAGYNDQSPLAGARVYRSQPDPNIGRAQEAAAELDDDGRIARACLWLRCH